MNLQLTNPWPWQDNFGYAQAVSITNPTRTLYCSGQAAVNAKGQPTGGTMSDQIRQCLLNLEQVIGQAGYRPENIVRLNLYTTSIPDFFAAYGTLLT